MAEIKPIETKYAGCRFRSRLEARWAVFFDALGIRWEYEKEGFELPSGRYLPDFWLPQFDCWFEIKPVEPDWQNSREFKLCQELGQAGHKVYLAVGLPGWDGETSGIFIVSPYWDNAMTFTRCEKCKAIKIIYGSEGSYWECDKGCGSLDPEPVRVAANAATSARFEFGESGAPQ